MVLWDTERYPDYQMFWTSPSRASAKMIIFATREFAAAEIDDLLSQMDDCDLDARREARLRKASARAARPRRRHLLAGTGLRLPLAPVRLRNAARLVRRIPQHGRRNHVAHRRRRGHGRGQTSRWAATFPRTELRRPCAMPCPLVDSRSHRLRKHARRSWPRSSAASACPGCRQGAGASRLRRSRSRRAAFCTRRSTICTTPDRCAACRGRRAPARRPSARGEKILIYGDYDVDGTTSVVLLTKAIEMAGGAARLPCSAPPEGRLRHARRGGGNGRRARASS